MQKEESFWCGIKRGLLELKDILTSKDKNGIAYNILLIGETGSGKTSFLNLLCNFKLVLKLKDDSSIKKLNKFHNEALENVKAAEMESATTGATYYQVDFEEVNLGVVDTPGFGDSRGLDQDKETVKKIVDTVNDVEYINCICLIINGRMARMTSQLQHVISEISAVLPIVTVKNTIVVFTNVKSQCDTNFRVEQLTPYLGHSISDGKIFYFDNPWCILDHMKRTKATKDLQKAFRRASESLERMFNTIKTFEPIHTKLFMDLFLANEAIERKLHELLLAAQSKTTIEEAIKKKKEEIDTAVAAKSLNANFETMIKVPKWTIQPTAQHNIVCELCNSNCHTMDSLPFSKDDREILRNSTCMQGDSTCTVCGHTYYMHMHAHFLNKLEEVETVFVNEDMKKAFEKAEIEIESLRKDMKTRLDKKLHKIEEEISDHFKNLNNKIQLFEAHASTPSYLTLLSCQLVVINQRIGAMSGTRSSGVDDLIRTKEELEAKINFIGQTTTGCACLQNEESFRSGIKRGLLGLKDVLTSKDQDGVAYNMLLIGETGSGKTSFLNLLCNFKMVLKLKDDSCIKKLYKFHDEALENVKAVQMESATTGAKYYQLDFEEVNLGVVDTPGFGDASQDNENVKKIVDKVNDVEYINCICLIINGRMARMTSQLQYVISNMQPTVTNTIVIFTNAKSRCDTNFCVDQITPYLGHSIPDDKIFYFDNPWCKLAKMEKTKATKDLQKAFQRASESLERMFNTIKTFEPIHTTLFMNLFLAKEAVERMMHELLLAVQNKVTLEETITNKKKEIDTAIAAKSMNSNFEITIKVPKWTIQPTAQHNTMCELCYSNCHPMCGLPFLKDDREILKNCTCMQESNFTCTCCGHAYDVHVHAHFLNKLEEVETVFVNEDMKKAYEKAEIHIELLVQDMKERLDKERNKIEEEISDHIENLKNKIQFFEANASTPSYLKLLHCQLVVINQRIKAMSGTSISGADDLIRTKEELEKKITLVGRTTTV